MCERETYNGKSKPVESVRECCPAGEIAILPESIKKRVVAPVVMTNAV